MTETSGAKVLRGYQVEAIAASRRAMSQGAKRIVIYSPTGSGKTEIAIAIIQSAVERGKRVAFLANRLKLVHQASRRLAKSRIQHGIIQGDNTYGEHLPVVVCSIQTVARRFLPMVDLIIVDEAHGVSGSKDYRNLLMERNAVPVIGLTATPFSRGMAKPYEELGGPLFEKMIVASTIQSLIEDGHLVDVDIYAPSAPDLTGVKTSRNAFGELDYSERDLSAACNTKTLTGSIVGHWMALAKGKPTVVFAVDIAHSKAICRDFNKAGIAAEHIDCYAEPEESDAILERLMQGKTKVVCNVGILAEGWDFPACEVMILARPTRSLIRYIQMVGRVLRPAPGKQRALVLDHSGSTQRLGYPTDDLPLELDDGSPKESSGSQKKEEDLPKKCPSCSFVKPPKVHKCPSCGFAPERQSKIDQDDGKLVKLDRKKQVKFGKCEKQTFYGQMLYLAQSRGYKKCWAAVKYKEFFGVWPRGLVEEASLPQPGDTNYLNYWSRSGGRAWPHHKGGKNAESRSCSR